MRTFLRIALIISVLFVLTSCYPSSELLRSEGDTATIEMTDKKTYVGEFLFVKDSAIVVLSGDLLKKGQFANPRTVYRIPLASVASVQIDGYANRKWVGTFVLFQVIPTILFGIEIASHSSNVDWGSVLLAFGAPSVLTYVFLETSTPPAPRLTSPFAGMDTFTKYSRFPKGLDDLQLNELLKSHGQTVADTLK